MVLGFILYEAFDVVYLQVLSVGGGKFLSLVLRYR